MKSSVDHYQDNELIPGLRLEWMILARRRRLIMAIPLLAAIGAAAYNYSVRPVYDGIAIVSIKQALGRARLDEQALSEMINEEMGRITSVDFAASVVAQIGDSERAELARGTVQAWWPRLRSAAGEAQRPAAPLTTAAAVGGLLSRVRVVWRDPSSWVEIRVTGYDPKALAGLANAVAQTYIRDTAASNRESIEASRTEMDQQIEDRQKELGQQLTGLVDLGEQTGRPRKAMVERQILALQEALVAARTGRIGRAATRRDMARLEEGGLVASVNPRVQAARDRLSALEDKEKALLASLGARHPDVVTVQEEIETARSRLTAATQAEVRTANAAFDLALSEESRIEASLRRAQKELEELEKESVDYTMSQKQAEVSRIAVERLMHRQDLADLAPPVIILESSLVQAAIPPSAPSSPLKRRNFVYALVGGLLCGIVLAWLRERFDDSIQSPEDIKGLLGLPFLGMVPLVSKLAGAPLGVSLLDARTGFADALRVVRTNLIYGALSGKTKVLLFTSASPGDGKSTVASTVALLLRETQARVLLIDGDLRRPTLHTIFDVRPVPGLSEFLAGPEDADPPISSGLDIDVLPAGKPQIVSAAQLGSPTMRRLVQQARDRYDWVIIDSPPSLGLPDSSVLSTMVAGVVVVCAGDRTPRQALQSVTDQLRSVGASILGVVLNRVDMNRHSYYYGRHYSAYYGTPGGTGAKQAPEKPPPEGRPGQEQEAQG